MNIEQLNKEITDYGNAEGTSISVVLQLSEPLRSTLQALLREGPFSAQKLADHLGLTAEQVVDVLAKLLYYGFVFLKSEDSYALKLKKATRPNMGAMWETLLDEDT